MANAQVTPGATVNIGSHSRWRRPMAERNTTPPTFVRGNDVIDRLAADPFVADDGTGAAGVEVSTGRAGSAGIFTEDTPVAPRIWACQHCGAPIVGKVRASFNGAPLCMATSMDDKASCYCLVSTLNHQMPCQGDPCPGPVLMKHIHEDGDDHDGNQEETGQGHGSAEEAVPESH